MKDWKVFTQACPPEKVDENLDTQDVACLDTTSLTTVVEFMHKFADDATFSPPTREVMYDTENYNVSIDDEDVPETFADIEDLLSSEELNARAD